MKTKGQRRQEDRRIIRGQLRNTTDPNAVVKKAWGGGYKVSALNDAD